MLQELAGISRLVAVKAGGCYLRLRAAVAANLAAKAADSVSIKLKIKARGPNLNLEFLKAAKVVVGKGGRQQV